jgi:hypothetical protein
MANKNRVHVVLIDGSTNLIHQMKDWGDSEGGSTGIEAVVSSGLQVVGIWVEKDVNGEAGGPFFDEYSGNSMYALQETFEGISIALHDITPASTRIRETLNDKTLRPIRHIDPKLADATMGKGSNWDVFENGQGSLYEEKLAAAQVLVGVPI